MIVFLVMGVMAVSMTPNSHARNSKDPTDQTAGIVLADDQGKVLFSQNRDRQFVPASTLKILTSLAALHYLGPDHRFSTRYCFDNQSKSLYIKGFGDPLFISEVIGSFCKDVISKTRLQQARQIVLDHSYFSGGIQIPGASNSLNPYDASSGALCANFNTVMFKWDTQKKQFVSGEPQTPLLDIFLPDIKRTGLKRGRIVLSRQQSLLYPGFLVKYFLEQNNVRITGPVGPGKLPTGTGYEHSFFSPYTLKDVVQKLLEFSSNFTANQLLLTMGAKTYGAPASLEKGVAALKGFAQNELGLKDLALVEGSGLSRSNLISPDQMMKILAGFMPYHYLMNHEARHFFKTGTLTHVRTRAGYILGQDGRLYPYVIMVNHRNRGYDSILKRLDLLVSGLTHPHALTGTRKQESCEY
jgi:D-alanyl-D-alanine carboxypeptidase/D-alanyl-D-alanine-endopeptidase (penicillin-binding protein 4)